MHIFRIVSIYSLVLAVPCVVLGGEPLTGPEIFSLMKASRDRYRAFDAELESIVTRSIEGKTETVHSKSIVSRWTPDKQFGHVVSTSHIVGDGPDFTPVRTYTRTSARQWQKRLVESPGREPHGYITAPDAEPREFSTIYDAMWNIFDTPWERLDVDRAVVLFDEGTDTYTVEVQVRDLPNSPVLRLRVDPSKGFIPIEREYVKYTGEVVARNECKDIRWTENGLPIPYEYSWIVRNATNTHRVKRVNVNTPIPEDLLDFAFPAGTVVEDQLSNLRYTIGAADPGGDMMIGHGDNTSKAEHGGLLPSTAVDGTTSLLMEEDLAEAPLADDNALAPTAEQAHSLLGDSIHVQGRHGVVLAILLVAGIALLSLGLVALRMGKRAN